MLFSIVHGEYLKKAKAGKYLSVYLGHRGSNNENQKLICNFKCEENHFDGTKERYAIKNADKR